MVCFQLKDERDQALTTILPYVRFPFMSPRFLVTVSQRALFVCSFTRSFGEDQWIVR
jgi:hypothetical protein